jgi:hypothetical protein
MSIVLIVVILGSIGALYGKVTTMYQPGQHCRGQDPCCASADLEQA